MIKFEARVSELNLSSLVSLDYGFYHIKYNDDSVFCCVFNGGFLDLDNGLTFSRLGNPLEVHKIDVDFKYDGEKEELKSSINDLENGDVFIDKYGTIGIKFNGLRCKENRFIAIAQLFDKDNALTYYPESALWRENILHNSTKLTKIFSFRNEKFA